jgi:hypothetical protein
MKIYYLLLSFIFLSCFACSREENNINDNDGFHIYNGIRFRGMGAPEYKFRNVPSDAGFLTSFPSEAIKAGLSENILDSVNIEYWLYTSIDCAELAMVERLDMSNLYMQNIIDFPLPKGRIGDNC